MPTFRVTDPNTGRTVKLTGDTPPTEQELEDVFKALGPVDGAAPASSPTPAAPSSPLVAWNGLTGSLIPKQTQLNAASAIAGSEQAPLNPEVSRLPLLGPILDLARTVSEAGPDVARGLVGNPLQPFVNAGPTLRGFAAGATEGLMDLASPLNIALQALPYLRSLKGRPAPAPSPLAARTGTGAVPLEPTPAAGGFSAPTGTATLPGPAPRALPPEAIATGTGATPRAGIPQAGGFSVPPRPATVPNPMARTTGTAATPAAGIPQAGGFSRPPARPTTPALPETRVTGTAAAPVEPIPAGTASPVRTGTGGFSMTVKAAEDAVAPPAAPSVPPASSAPSALEQALRASLAERLAKTTSAADVAETVVKTADEIATTASPVAAAEAVEKAVPQTVKQMVADMRRMFGSDRAGKMIYGDSLSPKAAREAVERVAPGPSRHPLTAEVDALDRGFLEKLADPKGAASPTLVQQLGGAAAGAAVGATQGDDTDDRVVNALLGAGLGATAVPLIAKLATTGLTRTPGSITPKEVQDTLYGSILSSPTSVAKAYLGALGGTVSAAIEKAAAGDASSSARILRTLMSPQSVTTFVNALRNPQATSGMAADAPTVIGRIFGAGDAVARRAMAAGGIGADEAARFTLSGMPTTPLAQDVLRTMNKYFELRLVTTLFPRVGMQIVERGLERTPAGLVGLTGLNEGATGAMKVARAGLGTAAGIASYAYSDQVPDWAKPYVAAVSGVYSLPVGIGLAAGEAAERGKDIEGQAAAGVQAFANNLPFPQYGPTESIMQFATGSSLIPNAVRDVAVAMDPYERDTSGSRFDRARAKLPGLREQLPVKDRRVNIAGEPITDRSTPFKRVFNPAPTRNAPFAGIPDAVKTEIERLDISINPPNSKVKVRGKTVEIPPDVAERVMRQRREFLVPAIEKLIAQPSYQSASDDVKRRRLNAVIQQAEERGEANARKTIAQALRGSNANRP